MRLRIQQIIRIDSLDKAARIADQHSLTVDLYSYSAQHRIVTMAKRIYQSLSKCPFIKIWDGNAKQSLFHFRFMVPCSNILCNLFKG